MAILREERIGSQRLILGDCLQVMPTLGRFDAVVTDPPYGIAYKPGTGGKGRHSAGPGYRSSTKRVEGDAEPFDPKPFLDQPCILWGANHYAARLPHGRWLAWNKLGDCPPMGDTFSDVEFAWQNVRASDKIFSLLWKGLCMAPSERLKRTHPTQKPVALMEWCLGFLPDAKTILDPFMGSGTTLVACQRMGRHGTGIELDPDYFDIACKRVDEAARQPDLLIPETLPQPTQEAMDL